MMSALQQRWRALGLATRWLVAACLLTGLALFAVQLAEIPQRSALRGSDNTYNYFWLRSLMVDGDWDFRNDIEENNTLTDAYRQRARELPLTPTGRVANKYGVGWALASVPGYLVADGLVSIGRRAGWWTYSNDGYNAVYQVVLQTWHLALAAVALLLAYRVARRWCDREPAVRGVALIWATSPLLYYQTSNLSMSHGVTFLALALCVFGAVRAEESPSERLPWILIGVGFGLAAITRFQAAIYGLIAVWAWVVCGGGIRAKMRTGLLMLAGAVPLLALQVMAWKATYGTYLVFSYGEVGEGFNWLSPAVAQVLGSSYHGLFYWHPFLLAGVAGLLALARAKGGLAVVGVAGAGLTIYVNAAWWCWWFGAAFGGRAFEGLWLFAMAGLAWLFERLPARAGGWLFAGGIALAALNLFWLVCYRLSWVPRNDPVSYGDLLRVLGRWIN